MKRSRVIGEGSTPRRRVRAVSTRLGARIRAALLAALGAAALGAAPALASDCLPEVVKTHAIATHPRPHTRTKATTPRKVAHHRLHAKRTTGHKMARRTAPALRMPAASPAALSAPTRKAQPAGFVRKTACPVLPAGAAMSVIPGTIVEAANELPYADLLPSAAPAVAGRDAAANEPANPGPGQDELVAALTPGFPRGPGGGMLSWGFPASGAGGGGGSGGGGGGGTGGTQTPTTPTTPTVPGEPTPPVVVTPPGGGDNPTPTFPSPGVETPTPPPVITTPGDGGGGLPPGGGTQPAAAPEPATWAMMILGFGLVGSAARRRRLRAAA